MTEEFSYQAYDLGQVLALLRSYLGDRVKAHKEDVAAFEARKAGVVAAYQAWPYRDKSCAPEWRGFSPAELAQWQGVAWPKLLQEFFPSLQRKFIVTGTEVISGGLETLPKPTSMQAQFKRLVKTYAWKICRREIADRRGYNAASQTHLDKYRVANQAWSKLNILQTQEADGQNYISFEGQPVPHQDENIPLLQACAQGLGSLAKQQGESPVLWLADDEIAFLRNGLSTDAPGTILLYYESILRGQKKREALYARHEREQHDKQYELEKFDDPSLKKNILECLRKSETGSYLLDFAENHGVQIELVKRKYDIREIECPPQGFCDASGNIELICDDDLNLADLAVILGHELRHSWQKKHPAFSAYCSDSPVDLLVRNQLREADAYAIDARIEYELMEKGIRRSQSSPYQGSALKSFEETALSFRNEFGITREKSLLFATYFFFIDFLASDFLDRYEDDARIQDAKLFENPDLPELIRKSPFFQSDFLTRLTQFNGVPFHIPSIIPAIQGKLLTIGKSAFARPPVPPKATVNKFPQLAVA